MEPFKDMRVSVLEADRSVCKSLTEAIKSWGLCLERFTRPQAIFENITHSKCDVLLFDMSLCDEYCPELIQRLSDDRKIIMMTGCAEKHLAFRAIKSGAFDLIEKPFDTEVLYHLLLRAFTSLKNERMLKRTTADLEKSRLDLIDQQQRLEILNTELLHTRRALSVLAENFERERERSEKQFALKLRNLMAPSLMTLKNYDQDSNEYRSLIDILIKQIEGLASESALDSGLAALLSNKEMKVASLTKDGMVTKEIASYLSISEQTVRTHRKNIRRKLKIKNPQHSLKSFLVSRVERRQAG